MHRDIINNVAYIGNVVACRMSIEQMPLKKIGRALKIYLKIHESDNYFCDITIAVIYLA